MRLPMLLRNASRLCNKHTEESMSDTKDVFADVNLDPQPYETMDFDHILVIGRTYDEYNDMFLLDDIKPSDGKIMNVAGGVSSFTAEAADRGFTIFSGDPIYCLEPDTIEAKCENDIENSITNLTRLPHMFNWGHPLRDIDHVRENRRKAYKAFLEDFRNNRWRYLDACFPFTPFIAPDNFSLSLVSHLLFIYDNFINYEAHVKIIKELLRITSGEIRIYPLVNLQFQPSEIVEPIMNDPGFEGVSFEIRPSRYNFIKNADSMMVIRKLN